MDNKVAISIAEIPLEIISSNSEFIDGIKQRYNKFLTKKSGIYKIKIEVKNIKHSKISPQILRCNSGYRILYNNLEANFNIKKKIINVFQPTNYFLFNSLLRILFSLLLLKENGFLLHSCCLKKRKYGYVFFGKSFSGKTTISKQVKKFEVLNDEITAIKIKHFKRRLNFLCFGTPFSGDGKIEKNSYCEIKKIFHLTQDNKNFIEELSEKNAFKKILNCILFFSDDIILTKKLFQIVNSLLNNFSVYNLHFTKNIKLENILT